MANCLENKGEVDALEIPQVLRQLDAEFVINEDEVPSWHERLRQLPIRLWTGNDLSGPLPLEIMRQDLCWVIFRSL